MSISMMLAPNKSIIDNNQVMDNQLHPKVARMSFFMLVSLMISTHDRRHRLTNADAMPVSAHADVPLHVKTSVNT